MDFDPVRAKAAGRDPGLPEPLAGLFPDGFEDFSALGDIPKGWRLGTFGEIAEEDRSPENPNRCPDVEFLHYSIPAFDAGQEPVVAPGRSILSLKWRVPGGAVLLSKLNPAIDRVWMTDVTPDERTICSTEFLVLRARAPFAREYVYCLARSPTFRQEVASLVTGTSTSHQRAHAGDILNLSVVVPPEPIIEWFEQTVGAVVARALLSRRESRTLGELRDSLLPKLISGELRVPGNELALEATAL